MSTKPPNIPGLRYLQQLGAGGYADVYLYEQLMPQRRVAVKVLRAVNLSKAALEQFRVEANLMASLVHPNIVPVYAASQTLDGRPYIVMMYYSRASLGERVKREKFSVAEVLQTGIKLASAIETAHRAGILHRDIKPANVLIDHYGNPGLGDFGIAGEISSNEDDLGVSVPWSPVELLYSTDAPSVRSDVYSLSATLWNLLAGHSPFEIVGGDNSQYELMRRIRDVSPPNIGRPDVPTALDRLLRSSMAKDPALRPKSALEFARSLQAIEQELRLPRTELILAVDGSGRTINRLELSDDSTRLRNRVDGQADIQLSSKPKPKPNISEPAFNPENNLRTPILGVNDSASTMRRPDRITKPEQVTKSDSVEPKKPKWWWIGLAVLLMGAILTVYLFLTRPQVSPPPVVVPKENTIKPELTMDSPPGRLKIIGRRTDKKIFFSWEYENALNDDTFIWKASENGEGKRLTHPNLTLNGQEAGEVCIWVRVIRFTGNNAQKYFTKGCVK